MTVAVSFSAAEKSLIPIIDAVRELVSEAGAMPSERAVAEQLQVKRHQVRRVLETLRANGELEPARVGRRSTPDPRFSGDLASVTNPLEIIELRTLLEPPLARLAAMRASPAEIIRIQRATVTPADADPGMVDLAFHRAVAQGSRNSLAAELYGLLREVATDARLRLGAAGGRKCPRRVSERDAEHAAIAKAIAGRDPEAAERAMRDHLVAVQRQILARLSPSPREG